MQLLDTRIGRSLAPIRALFVLLAYKVDPGITLETSALLGERIARVHFVPFVLTRGGRPTHRGLSRWSLARGMGLLPDLALVTITIVGIFPTWPPAASPVSPAQW